MNDKKDMNSPVQPDLKADGEAGIGGLLGIYVTLVGCSSIWLIYSRFGAVDESSQLLAGLHSHAKQLLSLVWQVDLFLPYAGLTICALIAARLAFARRFAMCVHAYSTVSIFVTGFYYGDIARAVVGDPTFQVPWPYYVQYVGGFAWSLAAFLYIANSSRVKNTLVK